MSNFVNSGKLLLRGGLYSGIAQSAARVVGLITLPIFTYYLSPADFGIVSLVNAIISFLGLLYNPGMLSAMTRLYHDTNSDYDRKELISSSMVFALVFPFLVSVFLLFFGEKIFSLFVDNLDFRPFGIMAIILAYFVQPKRIYLQFLTLNYRVQKVATISVIMLLFMTILALIFVVYFKMGAFGQILAMLPPSIVMVFISIRSIKTYTSSKWSIESVLKQLRMGTTLIPAIISYEILNISDRLILGKFVQLGELGLYSFSYTLSQFPIILISGVKQLWNPIFYESMNNGDVKNISKLSRFYLVFLGALCLLIILFTSEVLTYIVDVRFHEAYKLVSIITVGIFMFGATTITNGFIAYKKKFWNTSFIGLTSAISNIFLNFILVPYYGIYGSAIATLVCYFFYLFLSYFFLRNEFGDFKLTGLLILIILYLLMTMMVVFFQPINNSLTYFVLKILIFVIFIVGVVLFRQISLEDVKLILYKK